MGFASPSALERHMVTTARRTRIRPGSESAYVQLHSRIPVAVWSALRECGFNEWTIGRDGSTLFHLIQTDGPLADALARIDERGTVDAFWDAAIDRLIDGSVESSVELEQVWRMTRDGQQSGRGGRVSP